MGPRLANTGDPLENERTAALAKNAPIKTFMIGCLFFSAALDKVVNPSLRLPARKDFAAEPALVCVKRAKAAPVSITLIPNWREGFLLALPRRLTIPPLRGILYLTTWFITFTYWTWVLITRYMIDCPFMITPFAP